MRAARRALTPLVRRRASAAITRRLARLPAFRQARDVALYVSTDGEIDLAPLAGLAVARGKRVWLPVVRPGGRMEFARSLPGTPVRRNSFGIPEPACFARQRRGAARMDLVIVPLVAFDRSGHRLGMGGGYYDRALAGVRRPYVAGASFALQEVNRLPARHWDIPMRIIVTERGIVRPVSKTARRP